MRDGWRLRMCEGRRVGLNGSIGSTVKGLVSLLLAAGKKCGFGVSLTLALGKAAATKDGDSARDSSSAVRGFAGVMGLSRAGEAVGEFPIERACSGMEMTVSFLFLLLAPKRLLTHSIVFAGSVRVRFLFLSLSSLGIFWS